jgi:diguanylate cyclase (GGDEF)-like protein/PAS domain S-box-containing protein
MPLASGQANLEILCLLSKKLAALLDREASQREIVSQLEQQRCSEERLAAVLKGTNDGWWDLDLLTGDCFLSTRWLEMMGLENESQLDERPFWRSRIHPSDQQRFDWIFNQALAGSSDGIDIEVKIQHEASHYIPVLIRGSVFRDSTGAPLRFSGSMQDLTERKQQEAHIKRLAFYDVLTDLPNRRLLSDEIDGLIKTSLREGHCFALMLLDLDRFKSLNDTRGHAAGDQLLCAVADRIRGCLRPSDMVGRLGGDEFIVLVRGLGSELLNASVKALAVAEKIRAVVAEPLTLDTGVIHQTVSIGVTLFDSPDLSGETLIQRADVALYEAKSLGRNSIISFREDMQRRMNRRVLLEERLYEACGTQGFQVAYQLQVDHHAQPVGAEALLRLPVSGDDEISPSEFIPVAEESGLMLAMGDFVITQVAADLAQCSVQLPPGFHFAINLGTSEFMHDLFVLRITEMLTELDIHPERLIFEITEDVVLSDLGLASYRMNQLRDLGISFSLDDFGTGHSSFSYLRQLPVSELKIDRSFVHRFLYEPQDHAIVRTILSLADSLGLRVVAEGVETEQQYQQLMNLGCRFFQGFLFDHPQTNIQKPLVQRLHTVADYGRSIV